MKKNTLKYDPELSRAFWRKDKQKNLPDFDCWKVWDKVIENNPELKTLIIRGKLSSFLTEETAKKMQLNNNIFYRRS